MSMTENLYCVVSDGATPHVGGGVAYTLRARDYKMPQAVCICLNVKEGHKWM